MLAFNARALVRKMADDDLDHSISLALQQVGCPSVTLKAEQRSCIKSVCDGKDVFLWLPTGFGKSLLRGVAVRSWLQARQARLFGDRGIPSSFSHD